MEERTTVPVESFNDDLFYENVKNSPGETECFDSGTAVPKEINVANEIYESDDLEKKLRLYELEIARLKTQIKLAKVGNQHILGSSTTTPSRPSTSHINEVPERSSEFRMSKNVSQVPRTSDISIPELLSLCMGLPKKEIPKFDGNPLKYWSFIRAFTSGVARYTEDPANRLSYLWYYCEGEAREVIEHCTMLDPTVGYEEALKVLEDQFGDSRTIAREYLSDITRGPPLKVNDAKGLSRLAGKMQACEVTLNQLKCCAKLNTEGTFGAIASRFPSIMQFQWYDHAASIQKTGRDPSFGDLTEFVRDKAAAARLQQQCSPEFNNEVQKHTNNSHNPLKQRVFSLATNANHGVRRSVSITCLKCGQHHYLDQCPKFIDLPQPDRLKFVVDSALCKLCLKANHFANVCRSRRHCGLNACQLAHHPLLHIQSEHNVQCTESSSVSDRHVSINYQRGFNIQDNQIIAMGLVPVTIVGPNGRCTVTGLLDSGSDSTLIEERLATDIGLSGSPSKISLSTVHGRSSMISNRVTFHLEVEAPMDKIIQVQAWTVSRLPTVGSTTVSGDVTRNWKYLTGINFPKVMPSNIQVLIGMNVPVAHWVLESKRGGPNDPYAIKTPLGWMLLGPLGDPQERRMLHSLCSGSKICRQESEIKRMIEMLFKFDFLDGPSCRLANSIEDNIAIQEVTKSLKVVNGHYQLALPWKDGRPNLRNNFPLAYHRMESLKRRFTKDECLLTTYHREIMGYLEKGYAEPVGVCIEEQSQWFLPHHPVFHPSKPGKVRVVFDCAATWKGQKLNNELLSGPDINNSLFGVLLRFRRFKYVIKADIEAMFHQVGVPEADRRYLRFLWWANGNINSSLSTFQMKVHPFGATSSPFCASFALQQALKSNTLFNNSEILNEASRAFYVDDFLFSADSSSELQSVATLVKEALAAFGFRLTKWYSNTSVPDVSTEENSLKLNLNIDIQECNSGRTLGVRWDTITDDIVFEVKTSEGPITRRKLLSFLASLYDPFGLMAPVLLPAKLLLQELCKDELSWDEEVNASRQLQWNAWRTSLMSLNEIRIPRCIIQGSPFGCQFELHCFSDASERAYGTVLYLRTVTTLKERRINILCAKSRVAPLHAVSIPRLELTAAVLSARMAMQVREELSLPVRHVLFWTDSMIVLQMIRNRRTRFETFFANRLSVIHELSEVDQWKHITSKENPADITSRGLQADRIESSRWLSGPEFLLHDETRWPNDAANLEMDIHCCMSSKADEGNDTLPKESFLTRFSKYGTWMKLLRAVAWLRRFVLYLQRRTDLTVLLQGRLSTREIKEATHTVIRLLQKSFLVKELNVATLNSDSSICRTLKSTSSPIRYLSPFLDNGVLRVGGRIRWAPLPYGTKHPYIVPREHFVTTLIIMHYHARLGHVGPIQTLAAIREYFWIIRGLTAVKTVLKGCTFCARWFRGACQQQMAPLPTDRTLFGLKPFANSGVDYFGPILVKRGRGTEKRYGCLFTCLAIRAVHIEVAHSLDTDSFLCAFSRFVSRRGAPVRLYSDNGTNFRGAELDIKRCMSNWDHERISSNLLGRECDWIFTPPKASHYGGVWERLIRSIRRVLRGILADQLVTDEVLQTTLVEVEKVLNDRPLTRLTEDPRDNNALTPNQLLLISRNVASDPTECLPISPVSLTKKWRQVNHLCSKFWRRWKSEYLTTLQQMTKWITRSKNLEVGDLVLLVDRNTHRGTWLKGIVQETVTSKDGLVREVVLRTTDGIRRRHVRQLCLLEAHAAWNPASSGEC